MKWKPIWIAFAAVLLLLAFANGSGLGDLRLSKEELEQRLLDELSSDYVREDFFIENASYTSGIYLDHTVGDFLAVSKGKYRPKMLAIKHEIMDIIKSPEFYEKWKIKRFENGYNVGKNLKEMALNAVQWELQSKYTYGIENQEYNNLELEYQQCQTTLIELQQNLSSPAVLSNAFELAKLQKELYLLRSQQDVLLLASQKALLGEDSTKEAYRMKLYYENLVETFTSIQANIEEKDREINSAKEYGQEIKDLEAEKQALLSQLIPYQKVIEMPKKNMLAIEAACLKVKVEAYLVYGFGGRSEAELLAQMDKSTPEGMLKKIIHRFLEQTADVDFKAKLNNLQYFENPELEYKSRTWKFCYRRGEAFTKAARSVAEKWVKELGG